MNTDPIYDLVDDPVSLMLVAARMLVDQNFYDELGPNRRVVVKRAVRRYFKEFPEHVITLRVAS